MRMRESALMFNRFAEDAVKSILAPNVEQIISCFSYAEY
jgi:hypothetical protein